MAKEVAAVGYMPHLDGIRAFAVGAVIVEHWASGMPGTLRNIIASLDLGGWGVECFFVLSGFLITLLLLQAKESQPSFGTALGHFYGRRVLRIFPAYYLALGLLAVFATDSRHALWWHVFYLGNIYPLWHGTFVPVGGHFWSLALEEQFYLFWPLIVLWLPYRKLVCLALALALALALMFMGPATRWLLWQGMGEIHLSMWTFPTTALDLLAFGALLACVKHERQLSVDDAFVRRITGLGLAALVIYAIAFAIGRNTGEFVIIGRSLLALVFGALILRASFGIIGPAKAILGNPIMVWLGLISYGLYIYHPFVPHLYVAGLEQLGLPRDVWGAYYIRLPLLTAILLAVTASSFYLLEQPIRRLRKYLK
jgi:peptidoglycan/LPS O-acetylase OafA/YrhL